MFARPAFMGAYLDVNKTLYEMASMKTFIVPKVN